MTPLSNRPLRVLIVCTGNSARSQMAEAMLNRKGRGRLIAESAGSQPAARVNPYAVEALREAGIDWRGRQPRGMDDLRDKAWDIVITVCDRAKEACPIFPGQPVLGHWGMEDPAGVTGDEETKRHAFHEALQLISRRIDLMLALPMEKLERRALQEQLRAIGREEGARVQLDEAVSVPEPRPLSK
ncbi:MAG TPA: arsenate reductase ArsC [Gemmatimonadales bacterium]|nr:arsenate reductase ArsC [Gemmatimonadales bacterium]